MNFRILPSAQSDADQAAERLDGEHPGYGLAFDQEMATATRAVVAQPQMYPRTADGPQAPETREYYIKRFQYRLIYAVTATELVILAVVHARRRPRSWVRRLRELN